MDKLTVDCLYTVITNAANNFTLKLDGYYTPNEIYEIFKDDDVGISHINDYVHKTSFEGNSVVYSYW